MGAERFALAPESVPGTAEVSGFTYYPFTSIGGGANLQSVRSAEVNTNRNPRGGDAVDASQQWDVAFELQLGTFNAWLEALALSTFSSDLNISGTITATASDDSLNSTGLFTNIVAGQWISVGGLHASVNGFHKVLSKSSNDKIILHTNIASDQSGDGDETIKGSILRIGTTTKVFTGELQFPDQSIYSLATYLGLQSMSLDIAVGALLNGRMTLIGRKQASLGTTSAGTPSNASANGILSPVGDIAAVYNNSFASAYAISSNVIASIGFDWNNRYAPVSGLGTLGLIRLEKGIPEITARMRIDLTASGVLTFLQAYEAQTRRSLAVRVTDGTRSLIITFPRLYIQSMPTPVPANEGARFTDVSMIVEEDPTSLVAAQFDYFAAA